MRDHKDELKDHVFMINVDVGAPILGYNTAAVTGEESLVHYTDYMLKINGLSAVTLPEHLFFRFHPVCG